jgi:predicted acyltransferase
LNEAPLKPLEPQPNSRLLSLDVMRGLTMASMILVNNPGDWGKVHAPLLHATWHGCTFTDLVFPFFLFMVGASMPFSFEKRRSTSERRDLVVKILRRGLILFLLGFVLGLLPNVLWNPSVILTCRIPGVLQRIAICYTAVALLSLYTNSTARWIIAGVLIVIYSLGMFFIPVPGYGASSFEIEGNFCWWLDNQLLFGHTWSGAPAKGFDPEGVWSTLTAIAGTQFGYFAGQMLAKNDHAYKKVTMLFVFGQLSLLAGYVASFWMPINKQLWTTSYLFVVTGLALNVLAVFYLLIDIRGWRGGTTFWLVFGTNSILAYVLSSVLGDVFGLIPVGESDFKSWIVANLAQNGLSPRDASLIWALGFVLLCWLAVWPLYRANVRLRI